MPLRKRILIVDDHPLVRRGLTALIDNEPDLEICASATTRREALEAIAPSHPDLVITDLSLDDGHGLDLVKQIRAAHKELPVVVLTMHDAPLYARRAFKAGARGFVTKQEMGDALLTGIRRVLAGGEYVSPMIRDNDDPE